MIDSFCWIIDRLLPAAPNRTGLLAEAAPAVPAFTADAVPAARLVTRAITTGTFRDRRAISRR
jgi:hypothetical protein